MLCTAMYGNHKWQIVQSDAMLLPVDVLLLSFMTVRGGDLVCQPYGTKELSQFSMEGDIDIGGIFSFHQNPVTINPALHFNPGTIRCEG